MISIFFLSNACLLVFALFSGINAAPTSFIIADKCRSLGELREISHAKNTSFELLLSSAHPTKPSNCSICEVLQNSHFRRHGNSNDSIWLQKLKSSATLRLRIIIADNVGGAISKNSPRIDFSANSSCSPFSATNDATGTSSVSGLLPRITQLEVGRGARVFFSGPAALSRLPNLHTLDVSDACLDFVAPNAFRTLPPSFHSLKVPLRPPHRRPPTTNACTPGGGSDWIGRAALLLCDWSDQLHTNCAEQRPIETETAPIKSGADHHVTASFRANLNLTCSVILRANHNEGENKKKDDDDAIPWQRNLAFYWLTPDNKTLLYTAANKGSAADDLLPDWLRNDTRLRHVSRLAISIQPFYFPTLIRPIESVEAIPLDVPRNHRNHFSSSSPLLGRPIRIRSLLLIQAIRGYFSGEWTCIVAHRRTAAFSTLLFNSSSSPEGWEGEDDATVRWVSQHFVVRLTSEMTRSVFLITCVVGAAAGGGMLCVGLLIGCVRYCHESRCCRVRLDYSKNGLFERPLYFPSVIPVPLDENFDDFEGFEGFEKENADEKEDKNAERGGETKSIGTATVASSSPLRNATGWPSSRRVKAALLQQIGIRADELNAVAAFSPPIAVVARQTRGRAGKKNREKVCKRGAGREREEKTAGNEEKETEVRIGSSNTMSTILPPASILDESRSSSCSSRCSSSPSCCCSSSLESASYCSECDSSHASSSSFSSSGDAEGDDATGKKTTTTRKPDKLPASQQETQRQAEGGWSCPAAPPSSQLFNLSQKCFKRVRVISSTRSNDPECLMDEFARDHPESDGEHKRLEEIPFDSFEMPHHHHHKHHCRHHHHKHHHHHRDKQHHHRDKQHHHRDKQHHQQAHSSSLSSPVTLQMLSPGSISNSSLFSSSIKSRRSTNSSTLNISQLELEFSDQELASEYVDMLSELQRASAHGDPHTFFERMQHLRSRLARDLTRRTRKLRMNVNKSVRHMTQHTSEMASRLRKRFSIAQQHQQRHHQTDKEPDLEEAEEENEDVTVQEKGEEKEQQEKPWRNHPTDLNRHHHHRHHHHRHHHHRHRNAKEAAAKTTTKLEEEEEKDEQQDEEREEEEGEAAKTAAAEAERAPLRRRMSSSASCSANQGGTSWFSALHKKHHQKYREAIRNRLDMRRVQELDTAGERAGERAGDRAGEGEHPERHRRRTHTHHHHTRRLKIRGGRKRTAEDLSVSQIISVVSVQNVLQESDILQQEQQRQQQREGDADADGKSRRRRSGNIKEEAAAAADDADEMREKERDNAQQQLEMEEEESCTSMRAGEGEQGEKNKEQSRAHPAGAAMRQGGGGGGGMPHTRRLKKSLGVFKFFYDLGGAQQHHHRFAHTHAHTHAHTRTHKSACK